MGLGWQRTPWLARERGGSEVGLPGRWESALSGLDLASGQECPSSPNCLPTLDPPHLPRDVSSVELLMKYHQGIKAEIDTRSKNFSACLELGKSLLERQHQASEEVRGHRVKRSPSRSLPAFLPGQTASWEGAVGHGFPEETLSLMEPQGCVQAQGLEPHQPHPRLAA